MENIGVPAQFRLVSFATPSVNVLMQEDPSRHFQLLLRKRVALEIFQALARFFAGDLPRMLDTSAPFLQRYSLLQSKQRLSVVCFSNVRYFSAFPSTIFTPAIKTKAICCIFLVGWNRAVTEF